MNLQWLNIRNKYFLSNIVKYSNLARTNNLENVLQDLPKTEFVKVLDVTA